MIILLTSDRPSSWPQPLIGLSAAEARSPLELAHFRAHQATRTCNIRINNRQVWPQAADFTFKRPSVIIHHHHSHWRILQSETHFVQSSTPSLGCKQAGQWAIWTVEKTWTIPNYPPSRWAKKAKIHAGIQMDSRRPINSKPFAALTDELATFLTSRTSRIPWIEMPTPDVAVVAVVTVVAVVVPVVVAAFGASLKASTSLMLWNGLFIKFASVYLIKPIEFESRFFLESSSSHCVMERRRSRNFEFARWTKLEH